MSDRPRKAVRLAVAVRVGHEVCHDIVIESGDAAWPAFIGGFRRGRSLRSSFCDGESNRQVPFFRSQANPNVAYLKCHLRGRLERTGSRWFAGANRQLEPGAVGEGLHLHVEHGVVRADIDGDKLNSLIVELLDEFFQSRQIALD